jgi:hypothetical protein
MYIATVSADEIDEPRSAKETTKNVRPTHEEAANMAERKLVVRAS